MSDPRDEFEFYDEWLERDPDDNRSLYDFNEDCCIDAYGPTDLDLDNDE